MAQRRPAASSRSRLFVAGLLVSLAVVVAWRYTGSSSSLSRLTTSRSPTRKSNAGAASKEQSLPLDLDLNLVKDDQFDPEPQRRDMTPLSRRVSTQQQKKKRALADSSFGTAAEPIAITAALPSTDSLSKRFISTYDGFFNSLTASAEALLAETVTPELRKRTAGVPGTGISSAKEADSLQAYLDCVSSTGEWVHGPRGTSLAAVGGGLTVHKQESRHAACDKRYYKANGASTSGASGALTHASTTSEWNVRESLKWTWRASPTCESLAPSSLLRSSAARSSRSHLPSRRRLCELLARKSTLLLGDTTQYSLHDLILDWTTVKPQTCYGDLYCMQHVLCQDVLAVPEGRVHEVENWEVDDRVYHRLPLPPVVPPRQGTKLQVERRLDVPSDSSAAISADSPIDATELAKRGPSVKEGDALLRYRRTDGLRPARSQTRPMHRAPSTDVREYNQQWLADARRSDLAILNKAPLPLPRKGFNSTFDAWVRDFTAQSDGALSAEERALRVVEAAREVTERVWLPELVEALKAIRAPPSPADILVLYRGGWRQHADCAASSLDEVTAAIPPTSAGDGPPPHLSPPTLASLLMRRLTSDELELQPLHIAYHNAQLVFQNHLARTVVLLAFGIPFLDLEAPLSIWRSGMVGSSVASPFQALLGAREGGQTVLSSHSNAGKGLRSPASGDCTRYCFPSPGLAIERFFLGSMATVLEAGWAGSTERERAWVGSGFTTLKDRVG